MDDGGMQERVQQYGTWVLQALPVLLEIVRKGGRYTADSLEGLRDSFKVRGIGEDLHIVSFVCSGVHLCGAYLVCGLCGAYGV